MRGFAAARWSTFHRSWLASSFRLNAVCLLLTVLTVGACVPTQPPVEPEDTVPSWSPDGQWVAYFHSNPFDEADGPSGLYVTDVAGTEKRLLVPGPYSLGVDWSPDSRWLVFAGFNGLQVVSASGDSVRTIYGDALYPSWSPDGTEIAFTTMQESWVIHPDGTGLRRLTPKGLPSFDPDWSPDGRRLVITGLGPDLFIFRPGDSVETRLTHDAHFDFSPAWSPRGDLIAWNAWPQRDGHVHPELWVMDTLGRGRRHLADAETAPSWSPDGNWLVFSKRAYFATRLFVIRPDGSGLRQLHGRGSLATVSTSR